MFSTVTNLGYSDPSFVMFILRVHVIFTFYRVCRMRNLLHVPRMHAVMFSIVSRA